MKYLIYIQAPWDKISVLLALRARYNLASTGNVFHCTLMSGRFREQDESSIADFLNRVAQSQNPFETQFGEFDLFDEDSLAIRVQDTPELRTLHTAVVESIGKYDEAKERHALYYREHYAPHITIGHGPKIIPEENPLKDRKWRVTRFCIAKKDSSWKHVREFSLTEK